MSLVAKVFSLFKTASPRRFYGECQRCQRNDYLPWATEHGIRYCGRCWEKDALDYAAGTSDAAPQREISDSWHMLESFGFPPEACGWPFQSIAGELPNAIKCAMDCVIRQRDEAQRPSDPVPSHAKITENVGRWLSAALDDPQACDEMKADILAWMEAGKPNVQPPPFLAPSLPSSDAASGGADTPKLILDLSHIVDLCKTDNRHGDVLLGQIQEVAEAAIFNHNATPRPPQWRHKKRGSIYTEVARGPLQASTRQPAEDDTIVAYRGNDGRVFFREATEFDDGRFELVAPKHINAKALHMPDDQVVVRSRDADEAGDYRVMRHGDVVGNPDWEITSIKPEDLD